MAPITTKEESKAGSTEPIVAEAVVNASVDRVWDAFTTKAGIESRMVASGDIEARVGGRMRTSYQKGGDPEVQRMRAFFEVGNNATLEALVKRFAAR